MHMIQLMQNPGQTHIFYKAGQTHLSRTKGDPDDPNNPDELADLASALVCMYICIIYVRIYGFICMHACVHACIHYTISCLINYTNYAKYSAYSVCMYMHVYTKYAEHLVDIKFGDLGANTGWLTFSLVNQLSS